MWLPSHAREASAKGNLYGKICRPYNEEKVPLDTGISVACSVIIVQGFCRLMDNSTLSLLVFFRRVFHASLL